MLVRQGAESFYLALKAHEVIIFTAMNHLNSHVMLRVFIKREIDLRHASPRSAASHSILGKPFFFQILHTCSHLLSCAAFVFYHLVGTPPALPIGASPLY